MPTQLTTENATITTVAVTIQALKIGTKQVTQSVFKQLPEEPLIAQDGTLNGVPWGRVNWHPDKCEGSRRRHLHIVWQRGTELLRSRVNDIADFDWADRHDGKAMRDYLGRHSPASADLLNVVVLNAIAAGRTPTYFTREEDYSQGTPRARHTGPDMMPVDLVGPGPFRLHVTPHREALEALDAVSDLKDAESEAGKEPYSYLSPERQRELKEKAAQKLVAARARHASALAALRKRAENAGGIEAVNAALRAEVSRECGRRQRHRDTRAALAELPQLFIAV